VRPQYTAVVAHLSDSERRGVSISRFMEGPFQTGARAVFVVLDDSMRITCLP
jgi:hypothetical protein